MNTLKLTSTILLFLLLGSIQLFSQQADTLILPRLDKKPHIIGASFAQQGPKTKTGIGNNYALLLMYGIDFPSPENLTTNILSGNTYIMAKTGYLHRQFEDNSTNNDWIATLGVAIRQPLYKAEKLSLQFGVDMGILNRHSEKTVFYTCFNNSFLWNIYKGLEVGIELKVQANKLDNSYTSIGLNLNYKF